MSLEKNWRKIEKTGADRFHNVVTQPTRRYDVFNNHLKLTESWYPVTPSKSLKKGMAHSFLLGSQRVAIFRTQTGKLAALDAFCPHMGADLGNGQVVGERLQCYFHQWQYAQDGQLAKVPCREKVLPQVKIQTYPVEDKYGYVWVYAGPVAPYPVPNPPGLEDEDVSGVFIGEPTLFVHHHVMMVSAIDLQHFATVHKLDIDFAYETVKRNEDQYVWRVYGDLPHHGWRARLARLILGEQFEYSVVFSGGTVVAINYGNSPRFRGTGFRLPSIHILWGCTPQENGVSKVAIFLVQKSAKGIFGKVANFARYALSAAVLTLLRDDDVKAFPHMRFDPQNMIEQDRSAAQLIHILNQTKVSTWSFAD